MNKNHLFLDIHAIQVLPPSNINRDDTGSPKTAQFGGVTRARVSSQAWKKAIRDYFRDFGGEFHVGIRTMKIQEYIVGKILGKEASITEEEANKKAEAIFKAAGLKVKNGNLSALFFLGDAQADALAEAAIAGVSDKKELGSILKNNPEIDIALFGRMLADDPSQNEDASSQVAHAISTHAVQTEYDYFTAKDDLSTKENVGAAMIETNEFNSSTLYRYANVAIHEFMRQMNDDKNTAIKALRLYIEAFVKSMPTGKSNSYANQTYPQALLILIRDDRPISFVGAYENPIKSSKGYVEESIKRLFSEEARAQKFVHKPVAAFSLLVDDTWYPNENIHIAKTEKNLEDLLNNMTEELANIL